MPFRSILNHQSSLPESFKIKVKEIKGPKVGVSENILQGFTKSHNVSDKDLLKKQTEKGEFYFIKIPEKKLLVKDFVLLAFKSFVLPVFSSV